VFYKFSGKITCPGRNPGSGNNTGQKEREGFYIAKLAGMWYDKVNFDKGLGRI